MTHKLFLKKLTLISRAIRDEKSESEILTLIQESMPFLVSLEAMEAIAYALNYYNSAVKVEATIELKEAKTFQKERFIISAEVAMIAAKKNNKKHFEVLRHMRNGRLAAIDAHEACFAD
jgi:hypothetical protein